MVDNATLQAQGTKLLSLDELVAQHGKPLEHPSFDSNEAASHRTWLAIANYVAYHDARKLDVLFQGIEFPNMNLAQGNVTFPAAIQQAMTPATQQKFSYLRQTPRLFGSMSTRLQLFQNIVEGMDDPTANFRVGRNIRVNKDMGALKTTLEGGVKGLLKIFGANPAKILAARMPDANRALNKFLDTRVIQYGPNFMDVRIEYFNLTDVSVEGDHYSLGTILGGLETISDYKQIEIRALQTPFDPQTEQVKERIYEPGMKYTFEGYTHNPANPVFLYRYTFTEPAQLLKRVLRAFGDFTRRNLPSRLTKTEMQDEERIQKFLSQRIELDETAKSEFEAKVAAESARANAAEAKLTLEQSVSATNQVFGEMRTLAHDSKNYALTLRAGACDLLRESIRHLPTDLQQKYNNLFDSDESLTMGLQQMKQDLSLPQNIQPLIDQTQHTIDFIRNIAQHTQRSLSIIDDIISNERLVMAGGIPVDLQEIQYEKVIKPVVDNVKAVYPTVRIEYNLPQVMVDNLLQDMVVTADARLMKVALMNLVSNAVEASLPNGKVKIDVSQRPGGERLFTIINIYQSGYIPQDIAERLNSGEKFTTKEKGNATGAAASYNIITGPHNGKLTYESLGQDQEYGGKIRVVI